MPKAWIPKNARRLPPGTAADLHKYCELIAAGSMGARKASQTLWEAENRYIAENVFSYWTRGHRTSAFL
eukprot:scaffold1397_cov254-Pinguiococcus_pyrenoidosus.AAC.6